MCKKSCYFCKHGERNPGYPGTYWQPPEPGYTECLNTAVDFGKLNEIMDIDDEEKLAEVCGHYEARIIEKCGVCRITLGIPEHDIEHYVEDTPVCSKECQDNGYQEYYKATGGY